MSDTTKNEPIKVFISYASEDYEIAQKLYDDLKCAGIEPWLDRKDLLPGQNWRTTIPQVIIRDCRYFLLLISEKSVSKNGYIQKEQRMALDVADERPPDEIFIIPARIDNTEPIYERLRDIHWANLSDYDNGLRQILCSLKIEEDKIEMIMQKKYEIEFVNRMNELKFITNIYGVPPYLLIVAPIGYGKTRLIQTVHKTLQERGWMCIDISLSRKKKNYLKEIAKKILGEKGGGAVVKNPKNAGYKLGSYILERFKQDETKQQKKVLIQIDEVEALNENSARELLNQFIPAIADTLKNADIELRVIFAGRYILNWRELSHELRLIPIPLSPFDFDSVYQTVVYFDSKTKLSMTYDYKKKFVAWLMYFTGGHPGCMAEILIKYYGAAIAMICSNEKEIYDNIINRVVEDIKKHIPDNLKKIFDTLSVIRCFNGQMLRKFMDNKYNDEKIIEWSRDEYSLEDSLCQTYLVNRKGGFLQDDIARRLLSIHLRRANPNFYNNICEQAISFYSERLDDTESYGRDVIAIELLFQKIQYVRYKENGTKEHFFNYLKDIFSILKRGRDSIALIQAFIQRLNEDWEFHFVFNYLFREGSYDDEKPFSELKKKINDFFEELKGG